MKKLLLLLLLLPIFAFAQNTVTLPGGSKAFTPSWRYLSIVPDSLNQLWMFNSLSGKYNRVYTATEVNKYFGSQALWLDSAYFVGGGTSSADSISIRDGVFLPLQLTANTYSHQNGHQLRFDSIRFIGGSFSTGIYSHGVTVNTTGLTGSISTMGLGFGIDSNFQYHHILIHTDSTQIKGNPISFYPKLRFTQTGSGIGADKILTLGSNGNVNSMTRSAFATADSTFLILNQFDHAQRGSLWVDSALRSVLFENDSLAFYHGDVIYDTGGGGNGMSLKNGTRLNIFNPDNTSQYTFDNMELLPDSGLVIAEYPYDKGLIRINHDNIFDVEGRKFLKEGNAFTLTTTGTSGPATYSSGTLNIPQYSGGGGTTTNALTINNSGSGDASGSTFNGSAAKTISYNSIGAVPTTTMVNGKALSSNITLGLASSDFANQGTTTTILHGNASGNPSFGAVSLTTDISGVLPIANGGTGSGTQPFVDLTTNQATIAGNKGWTGTGTFTNNLPANTAGDELLLVNTGTATSGNEFYSPALNFQGQGFKSNSVAASQTILARVYLQTNQGATAANGNINYDFNLNGGGYATRYSFGTSGATTFTGGLFTNSFGGGAATPYTGIRSINATASTSGVPVQDAPGYDLLGTVWNTSGTPASNTFAFRRDARAVSSGTPIATTYWSSYVGASGTPTYVDRMSLDSRGYLSVLTGAVTVNKMYSGSAGVDSIVVHKSTGEFAVVAPNAGGGLTTANFVFNEVPSGTINSSNVTFTLANTPTSGTVQVYYNGLRQKVGTDYTISSSTITFTSAPLTGSTLITDYLK